MCQFPECACSSLIRSETDSIKSPNREKLGQSMKYANESLPYISALLIEWNWGSLETWNYANES